MNPFSRGVLEDPVSVIAGGGIGALGSLYGSALNAHPGAFLNEAALRAMQAQNYPNIGQDALLAARHVDFQNWAARRSKPLRYRESRYYDGPRKDF